LQPKLKVASVLPSTLGALLHYEKAYPKLAKEISAMNPLSSIKKEFDL